MKKAVDVLEQSLDATETKYFQHEGVVKDERSVPAHGPRLTAVEQTFELADVLRPRSDHSAGARPVVVNINLPDWARPEAIDVQVTDVRPDTGA